MSSEKERRGGEGDKNIDPMCKVMNYSILNSQIINFIPKQNVNNLRFL
jgi:hypothetical protein